MHRFVLIAAKAAVLGLVFIGACSEEFNFPSLPHRPPKTESTPVPVPTPTPSMPTLNPWGATYGGSLRDYGAAIRQTSDGGHIVVAYSASTDVSGLTNHGLDDAYILKLDSQGDVEWQKMLGGSDNDFFTAVRETADGGFVFAGTANSPVVDEISNHGGSDVWIVKLNHSGELLWQKMFGGSGPDNAQTISETADGGFVVAGGSASTDIPENTNHGNDDVYVLRLDQDGNLIWQTLIGGSMGEAASAVQPTPDGGFLVVASSMSTDIKGLANRGGMDVVVIKLKADGSLDWKVNAGGNNDDYAFSAALMPDGSLIVAGNSNSTDIAGNPPKGENDIYVLKFDGFGTLQWQKLLGGSKNEMGCSVIPSFDGGCVVVGGSASTDIAGLTANGGSADAYIAKLDSAGAMVWQKLFGGSGADMAYGVIEIQDHSLLAVGISGSDSLVSSMDVLVSRITPDGALPTDRHFSHRAVSTKTRDVASGTVNPAPGSMTVSP